MEIAIAVAIFGVVGSAVLTGLSTAHTASAVTQEQSAAENIARNQMEYIFSLPYSAPTSTYPSVATPSGYSVSAVAQQYIAGDINIERVVVTVQHGGVTVLTLESLRTDG
jgi:type II secretory pathway pseudopilin PulG